MAISLRPITAKKPIVGVNGQQVKALLRDVGAEAWNRLSAYPAQRTRYRRTHILEKGWTMEGPRVTGKGLEVIVGNKVEYAGFVQGFTRRRPRQRPVFKRYGWPNVEEVGKQAWDKRGPKLLAALQGR